MRRGRTDFTIAFVGEGAAELRVLTIMRNIYLPRFCGTSMRPYDAGGFGGDGALQRVKQYLGRADACAILIDTDAHWSQANREEAQKLNVSVFECRPCLECVLLQILGEHHHPTTKANKRAFERRFHCSAHHERLDSLLTKDVLDEARGRIELLDQLLRFLRA